MKLFTKRTLAMALTVTALTGAATFTSSPVSASYTLNPAVKDATPALYKQLLSAFRLIIIQVQKCRHFLTKMPSLLCPSEPLSKIAELKPLKQQ